MTNSIENDLLDECLVRKVKVPKRLLDLLDGVAVVMDATPKWCLQTLLKKVDDLASTRPELFGFEYERAYNRQQQHVVYEINTARLHRTDKTKSGFVGVYANGKGFTAQAKISATDSAQASLGTFPTAVQAAEVRRVHYYKHSIPYGRLGDKLESFRGTPMEGQSAAFQRQLAIYELAQAGTPAEDITDDERRWENEDPIAAAQTASMEANQAAKAKAAAEAHAKQIANTAALVAKQAQRKLAQELAPLVVDDVGE